MAKKKKKRLDQLLIDNGFVCNIREARAFTMAGKVLINKVPVDKPGALITIDSEIIVKNAQSPYVSRGALKLEKALKTLDISVNNDICLDVGASTGGFTDCLLQHGAAKVYAVDVGYGQLAWKLRQDKRVIVIERTNIRKMDTDTLSEPVDLVTIDTSFISLKAVIPSVIKFMKKDARILALIKPQFEVEKDEVEKGGVVKDPLLHKKIISHLSEYFFENLTLKTENVITSPVLGPKGNKEFIISLK